jgi:hypothetical protein
MMAFGDYDCPYYPTQFTIPRPGRSNSSVQTYTSVAHFSWGFFIAGKTIEINWNYMPSEIFDALDAIFQDNEEIVWDPDIPELSTTYNVQILNFSGEYFESVKSDAEIWRQNCRMSLLIISEVE